MYILKIYQFFNNINLAHYSECDVREDNEKENIFKDDANISSDSINDRDHQGMMGNLLGDI